MKRIKAGDKLKKVKGGGVREMVVTSVWSVREDSGEVTYRAYLKALASSSQDKSRSGVSSVSVKLGEDGLPEGWRRAS